MVVEFKRNYGLITGLFCLVAPIAPLIEKGWGHIASINVWVTWLLGIVLLLTIIMPMRIGSIIQIILTVSAGVLSMVTQYDNAFIVLIGIIGFNLVRVYGYLIKNRIPKILITIIIVASTWLITAIAQTQGVTVYTPIQFVLFMGMAILVYYNTFIYDQNEKSKSLTEREDRIQKDRTELEKERIEYNQKKHKESLIVDNLSRLNEEIIDRITELERRVK